MKKFFTYALSFIMMMSMSFTTTSCDSDDVLTALEIINQLLGNNGAALENTQWFSVDENRDGLVLAFYSGGKGALYIVEGGKYVEAQNVEYSYDSNTGILNFGGSQLEVIAFTANQSMTLKEDGKEYVFQYTTEQLPSVDEVNRQGQKGSVSLQGEMWGVQINNGFAVYSFEKANSGNIYVLDEQSQVQQTVPFTYSISGNTVSISYQGGGETWTVKSKDDNQMVVVEGGDEYTYIRYTNGARSFDLF